MNGWISGLAGLFDGYQYHPGPISIQIAQGKIVEIIGDIVSDADIDGRGKILSVPFVDGHTHLIFAGTRFDELALKLSGSSYDEILAKGGGIQSTVRSTRQASDEELNNLIIQRLDTMITHGTVAVEAKSGYGLDPEHEIRLLRVLNAVEHPITVYPTFGAAHVVPPEVSRAVYIEQITDEMLPVVIAESLATSTDVFCDRGAFTVEETQTIFEASTQRGLPVRVHAEELEYTGIARLAAAEYDLLSADHLLHATESDFQVLADYEVVAMFMPLAPFGLFSDQLPQGFSSTRVDLGLGSDFNPNNWALSMQTAIRMAVFRYRFTPLQAFRAATSGSFRGITGSSLARIQQGSEATFLLLHASSLSEFVSKFGQNLVSEVIVRGELVVQNTHRIH